MNSMTEAKASAFYPQNLAMNGVTDTKALTPNCISFARVTLGKSLRFAGECNLGTPLPNHNFRKTNAHASIPLCKNAIAKNRKSKI